MLLNLSTTDMEGLVGDRNVGGSLGCSDHVIVECSTGQEGSRAASKIVSMDFRRASFSLFRGSSWRNPMVTDPVGKRGPGELVDLKGSLLQGSIMIYPGEQELGQGERPVWMNKELVSLLECK